MTEAAATAERPNRHPFAMSFAMAGLLYAVAVVALFTFLGDPASSEGASEALGRLLVPPVVAGVAIGLAARRSSRRWRWWKYFALVFVVTVAVQVLSALGASS